MKDLTNFLEDEGFYQKVKKESPVFVGESFKSLRTAINVQKVHPNQILQVVVY